MFKLSSKSKANKSKNKLANQFEDVAGLVYDGEARKQLVRLRNILRQPQPFFPPNWNELDGELLSLVYRLRNQVNAQNISTASIYIEHINSLVGARTLKEEYVVDPDSNELLNLKVKMHEMIDDVKRLISENAIGIKKIERTPVGDPTLYMFESEKKAREMKYHDISKKIKHLASVITELMTRLKPEDIDFYERLRGLQGVPEELEDQTATYLFHQHKFETIAEDNRLIIESRYADAEPIPTPGSAFTQDIQLEHELDAVKKSTKSLIEKSKPEAE